MSMSTDFSSAVEYSQSMCRPILHVNLENIKQDNENCTLTQYAQKFVYTWCNINKSSNHTQTAYVAQLVSTYTSVPSKVMATYPQEYLGYYIQMHC